MKKLKNPESKKVKICVLSSIIPIVFNLVFFSYATRYIVDWQLFLMILLIYVSNRSEADFKNIKIPLVISTVAAMIIGFTYGVNLRSNFEKNSIKFISSVLPNKSLKYIYPVGKDIRISNHNLSCEELFQPYIIDIGNFSLQDENMIKVSRENPHLAIKFNRNENYEWLIDIDYKNESMTNFRINLMNTNYSYFLFVQPRTYNEITFVVEDKVIHTFVVKDNLIMDNLIKNSWSKRNCKNDNFEVIQDNAKTRWYEII